MIPARKIKQIVFSFFLAILAIFMTTSAGNWFRAFLHAFGVHWWTSWKEGELTSLTQIFYGSRYQERQCRICGMIDRRDI